MHSYHKYFTIFASVLYRTFNFSPCISVRYNTDANIVYNTYIHDNFVEHYSILQGSIRLWTYHYLFSSATVEAQRIDDVIGNLGRGRWIFNLTEDGPKSDELLCYEWFVSARVIRANRRLQCPPTSFVAFLDRRFNLASFAASIVCFHNTFPIRGAAVRCCYSLFTGALLTSNKSPGGVLSANPRFFSIADDEFGFQKCCVDTRLCIAYRIRRPKQRGEFYRIPRRGKSHFTTQKNTNNDTKLLKLFPKHWSV